MTPNASAGAIYPEGTPPQEVIDSLEVVLADLRHRVKLQNKKG